MAETAQGVVERINKNDNGFYGILVGGEWFGAGKYAPKFGEGDEVRFEYTANGKYKNLEFGSITVLERGSGKATSSNPASGKAVDWDAKDRRITYLASRKDALELVRMAVDTDSLTLPTKKADRLDVLVAFVDEMSDKLFKQIYGESFNGE